MNITITSTSDESITTGMVLGLIAIGVSTAMVVVGVLCEVLFVRRHEDDGAHLVYHRHTDGGGGGGEVQYV